MRGLIDSHCHLQHGRFDADRDAVIERAFEAGIERLMVPGWDLPSSEAALELAERQGSRMQAAVGVHPHHAAATDERAWRAIEGLIDDPRCAAVGEIGLDFFRNLSPPDVQRAAFDRQLSMAAARDLPVIVHDRDAHEELTATLSRWSGRRGARTRGVLHAFSGDAAMADEITAQGFLVSFALPISFRSAAGPRAAAAAIGPDTYLVETDAPYLGPDRDGRNEPRTALRVAAEVAGLRGIEPETVADEARRAYERLFVR
ncbi:MAG: TatD family hydrolase [Chloroflexota bacterium]|nr:TatD family hydrolase [Chloroflexota bacterium]